MPDQNKHANNGKNVLVREEAMYLLKESNALYRSILDTLQDAVYVIDSTGRFLLWNDAFVKVTGCSNEEIALKSPVDFIAPEDKDILAAAIAKVWTAGFAKVEARVVAKDGSYVMYEFASSLLKDPSGRIVGLCGSGRDIAQRKKILDELRDKINQLEIFTTAVTDREIRIIELKKKVEELEKKLKNNNRY